MKNHRTDLKSIARRAMIERGLLPDFSAAAMAELARVQTAATDGHSDMRDLTGLLWASIDNDDSRDLDQLTVAEPHPDRSVTILVAIADVDALVKKESALDAHAQAQYDVGLYGRRHISHAAGKAVDRSDISRRRARPLRDRRGDGHCGGWGGPQFDPLSGPGPQPREAGL